MICGKCNERKFIPQPFVLHLHSESNIIRMRKAYCCIEEKADSLRLILLTVAENASVFVQNILFFVQIFGKRADVF